MERDDEVKGNGNSYDFGARIYDSRLGRWLSVDPLQQEYPFVSPYTFALNSPITSIDPDGKKVIVTRIPNGGKDGRDLVIIKVDAKWIDNTSKASALEAQRKKVDGIEDKQSGRYKREQRKLNKMQTSYNVYAEREMAEIKASVESSFSGLDNNTEYQTQVTITDGKTDGLKSDDHVFYAVDDVKDATARANDFGGLALYYSPGESAFYSEAKTKAHEFGHLLGLLHNSDNLFNGKSLSELTGQEKHNIINQYGFGENLMDYNQTGMKVLGQQLLKVETNYNEGKLNKGNNTFDPNHGAGTKSSKTGYEIDYKKP